MYKKHGRDRESNLERQVKALVEKMLVEKGLSTMEPQTPMGPPGGCATPVATSMITFCLPIGTTNLQLVGARMRSTGVPVALEP